MRARLKLKITGKVKMKNGLRYILSDGRDVSKTRALKMQRKGMLPGYQIVKINGSEYLRCNPRKKGKCNISKKPTMKASEYRKKVIIVPRYEKS